MSSNLLRTAVVVLAAAFAQFHAGAEAAPPSTAPAAVPAAVEAAPVVPPSPPSVDPTSAVPAPAAQPPPAPAAAVDPTRAVATAPAVGASPGGANVFTLGLRLGGAASAGAVAGVVDSSEERSMSDEFGSGGLRVAVEAGVQFPGGMTLAAFFRGGPNPVGANQGGGLCETDYGCSNTRVFMYGVEALYHFRRGADLQPFVGAGFGWERSGYDVENRDPYSGAVGETATLRYKGMFLEAQAGVDYALSSRAFLGLFASSAVGRYTTVEMSGDGATMSGDIEETKLHGWNGLGLRVRFDLKP
jgi:hypothetical protein